MTIYALNVSLVLAVMSGVGCGIVGHRYRGPSKSVRAALLFLLLSGLAAISATVAALFHVYLVLPIACLAFFCNALLAVALAPETQYVEDLASEQHSTDHADA
jgi:hypothetical protein